MSPKDRVRANIYKELLNEEKVKNKRYMRASLSLFLVGIITSTSYHTFIKENVTQNMNSGVMVFNKNVDLSSQDKENNKMEIDRFFTKEIFNEKKIEVNTDQVFGYEYQI